MDNAAKANPVKTTVLNRTRRDAVELNKTDDDKKRTRPAQNIGKS